jgi:hypothetical protein
VLSGKEGMNPLKATHVISVDTKECEKLLSISSILRN